MKFTGTLTIPTLNIAAYQAALHKQLTEAIQQAAREWLHAVTAIVPVWSGASVSTFQNLADAAGYTLGVSPKAKFDRVSLGVGEGMGSITADPSSGQYVMEYSTTLAHLIFNEYNNANAGGDPKVFAKLLQPGPYHFQEHGQSAFQASAARVRLPNPLLHLTTKEIRVG